MTPGGRGGEEKKGERRADEDGKPLLGKPNLRGAQNAEAILRTYHRSRLRPPSPSRLRPLVVCPAFRPLPPRKSEERRRRTEGLKKGFSPLYIHLASFSLILSLSLSLYVSRCPLSSFSSFSDTSFSLLSVSTFFSCISDMKTVDRRTSKRPAAS